MQVPVQSQSGSADVHTPGTVHTLWSHCRILSPGNQPSSNMASSRGTWQRFPVSGKDRTHFTHVVTAVSKIYGSARAACCTLLYFNTDDGGTKEG